ncbi:hypothetical protein D3C79_968350 [compost metagenome]
MAAVIERALVRLGRIRVPVAARATCRHRFAVFLGRRARRLLMQVEPVHARRQVLEIRGQQRAVLVLFDADGAYRLAWAVGACQLELHLLGGLGEACAGQQCNEKRCFHVVSPCRGMMGVVPG